MAYLQSEPRFSLRFSIRCPSVPVVKRFGAVYSRCETDITIRLGLITEAFVLLWLTPELCLQGVALHRTAFKDHSTSTLSRDDIPCFVTVYRNPLDSVAV